MSNIYLTSCIDCGRATSKKYAREHQGQCKECVSGERQDDFRRRYGRCEDAPCCGCCGPQMDAQNGELEY
jgi:hypothetical protein